ETRAAADSMRRTLDQNPRRGAVSQSDQDEFVASVTSQDVALTKSALHRLRGIAQNAVASDMTLVVVDGLESVQVDENGKESLAGSASRFQQVLERLFDVAPIVEAG